jgi:hypothetical protein
VYVPLKGTIVTLHHLGGGKVVFNVGQFVCLQLENPSLFICKRGFEIFYIHIVPIFTKNRTINNFGGLNDVAFTETTPLVNKHRQDATCCIGRRRTQRGERSWHPEFGVLVEL